MVKHLPRIRPSAPTGRLTFRRKQVLRAKRNALQHAAKTLALQFLVDILSLVDGRFLHQQSQRVIARTQPLQPIQISPRQLLARELLTPQTGVQVGDRCVEYVVGHGLKAKAGSTAMSILNCFSRSELALI